MPRLTSNAEVRDWAVIGWFIGLFFCGVVAVLPVDDWLQLIFVSLLYVIAQILSQYRESGTARALALFLCAAVTLRYFVWRTVNTLGYSDFFSFISSLALYFAEVFGITLFFLSLVTTILPIERATAELKIDPEDPDLPVVDVLLPTYNEPESMLRVTVAAAVAMRYPVDKLRVHLLDDGGTDAKCMQADLPAAAAAVLRREQLQALCTEFGAYYRTRPDNSHAKSGNVNAALPHLDGDLVVVFDADHVPTVDFLEWTVSPFAEDPKLFLVQTPHFFINPDPLEKNMDSFEEGPAENAMFYRLILKGLDFWDAAIFCGSAAVLRRSCLAEIGGFSNETITEDAETAMELHARGYHSAYLDRPMISGLSAESFESFLIQRSRWGTGMLQILLLKQPMFRRGLGLAQRLCYLSSTLFWCFPIPRVVFLLAPTLYLIFGLRVYNTNSEQFLVFALPHIIASGLASSILFGKYRWPFVSTIYETMLSVLMLGGVVGTIRSPKTPLFKVTPKGSVLDHDFISPRAKPYYILMATMLIALIAGGLRLYLHAAEPGIIIITMGWCAVNFAVLAMSLGGMLEQRQRRNAHRIPVNLPVALTRVDGSPGLEGRFSDASAMGARFELAPGCEAPPQMSLVTLRVENEALRRDIDIDAVVRSIIRKDGIAVALGLEFKAPTPQQWKEIVTLVHGSSERWKEIWERDTTQFTGGMLARKYFSFITHQLPGHLREIYLDLRRMLLASLPKKSILPNSSTSTFTRP